MINPTIAVGARASVGRRRQVNRKLRPPTEIYLLKLEAAVRAAKEAARASWCNAGEFSDKLPLALVQKHDWTAVGE